MKVMTPIEVINSYLKFNSKENVKSYVFTSHYISEDETFFVIEVSCFEVERYDHYYLSYVAELPESIKRYDTFDDAVLSVITMKVNGR